MCHLGLDWSRWFRNSHPNRVARTCQHAGYGDGLGTQLVEYLNKSNYGVKDESKLAQLGEEPCLVCGKPQGMRVFLWGGSHLAFVSVSTMHWHTPLKKDGIHWKYCCREYFHRGKPQCCCWGFGILVSVDQSLSHYAIPQGHHLHCCFNKKSYW